MRFQGKIPTLFFSRSGFCCCFRRSACVLMDEEREGEGGGGIASKSGWLWMGGRVGEIFDRFLRMSWRCPPLIVSFTLKKVLQLFEILFMELLPYNVWWVETKIILLASIWLLHYTSNFFFLRGSFEFTSLSLQLIFSLKFLRNGLADFNYFLL